MLEGRGDEIPVSAMPIDGTWPSATAAWEKRNVAEAMPIWEPGHLRPVWPVQFRLSARVIQARYFDAGKLETAPDELQVGADQCARLPGCPVHAVLLDGGLHGLLLCAEACPARSRSSRSSDQLAEKLADRGRPGEPGLRHGLPVNDRARVDFANVRGVQFLEPLFNFSGACGGCGETPYLKLLSQLFGDRAQIANATGCSSIYGGNLPVTPWAKNQEGRGPAWSNSLFEDNAEFGLGFRLAADQHLELAESLLAVCSPKSARTSLRPS